MSGSEQYVGIINLDDGAKVAENLVKVGYTSQTDEYLQQLCQVKADNDNVAYDLSERELIFKKIIDAFVISQKLYTDEDKKRLFSYIQEALNNQMNPVTIGINDQTLAALIIEDASVPALAHHNSDVLELAHKLEQNSTFFELTAAKYVQADDTQIPHLTDRCLEFIQEQSAPKGVFFALALVNIGQTGSAMDILTALAQKGCATEMASYVHRLLPYAEDEIEELVELLEDNITHQAEIYTKGVLYDYSARLYLQAVRSFVEFGYGDAGQNLIEFLQQNQRLNFFDGEVESILQDIEEMRQIEIANKMKVALEQEQKEAKNAAELETAEDGEETINDEIQTDDAEETPVSSEAEEITENTTGEEHAVEKAEASEETVSPAREETTENVAVDENVSEMTEASEETTLSTGEEISENAIAEENVSELAEVSEETALPVGEETTENAIAEENMSEVAEASEETVSPAGEETTENVAVDENGQVVEVEDRPSYSAGDVTLESILYGVSAESISSIGESLATPAETTVSKTTDASVEDNSAVTPENENVAENTDTTVEVQQVSEADNPNNSSQSTSKSSLLKGAFKNVTGKVFGIKEGKNKLNINNMINIKNDNLDKLKDVAETAIKIAGEQTTKVIQKVDDLVKNDSTVTVENTDNNTNVEEVINSNEQSVINNEQDASNSSVAQPATNSKKAFSSFYEIPFWERENAEELAEREKALFEQSYSTDESLTDVSNSEDQLMSENSENTFGAENPEEFHTQGITEYTEDVSTAEDTANVSDTENTEESQEQAVAANFEDISMAENSDAEVEQVQELSAVEDNASNEVETNDIPQADDNSSKANSDDIDINDVSNYNALDGFSYQLDDFITPEQKNDTEGETSETSSDETSPSA